MARILSSSAVPAALLSQLREWFVAEWGDVDPFQGNHPDIRIPSPLVALDNKEKLLGGLSLTTAAKPDSVDTAVWINMVWISPHERNKGIASQLVRAAETEAERMHIAELFVLSEFPRLYEKLGWQKVGTDQLQSQTILAKVLTGA